MLGVSSEKCRRVSNKYGAVRQVGNPYLHCSLYNIVTLF